MSTPDCSETMRGIRKGVGGGRKMLVVRSDIEVIDPDTLVYLLLCQKQVQLPASGVPRLFRSARQAEAGLQVVLVVSVVSTASSIYACVLSTFTRFR